MGRCKNLGSLKFFLKFTSNYLRGLLAQSTEHTVIVFFFLFSIFCYLFFFHVYLYTVFKGYIPFQLLQNIGNIPCVVYYILIVKLNSLYLPLPHFYIAPVLPLVITFILYIYESVSFCYIH